MIGCLAAVAPPALQNTGRLLQRLLVEYVPAAVAGQRVHGVVQMPGEAQDNVESGLIIAMAAGVSVRWLLVELAAIRLSTYEKNKTNISDW